MSDGRSARAPAKQRSTGRARAPPTAAAGSRANNATIAIVLTRTRHLPSAHFRHPDICCNARATQKLHFSIVTGDFVLRACGAPEFKVWYARSAYKDTSRGLTR